MNGKSLHDSVPNIANRFPDEGSQSTPATHWNYHPSARVNQKSETWEKDGKGQKGDAHEDRRGSICPTDFYKIRLGTY